ncbi:MAG: DNRLRE domain-containing protein [Bacteroidota bacterium]
MKPFYILFLLLLLQLQSFSQTSITFTADRDNSIFSESLNSNGAGTDLFFGLNGSSNKRRGLVHFNLSSLPADAIISTASLNVYVNQLPSGTPVSHPLIVYKLTADWGEGTSASTGGSGTVATTNDATWVTRFTGMPSPWATAGGDFTTPLSGSVAIAALGAFSVSGPGIVADVQYWINNGSTNYGWLLAGNEGGPQTARRIGSREATIVEQRPTLTVTFTTLPVTLKAFSAQLQLPDVLLKWETATEINNLYFGIEHSLNGRTFTEINRVTGSGNSVLPKSYSFSHANVTGGRHFYRLAQHDVNGAIHFSQVVVADISTRKPMLQIAPNPVQSVLNVRASELLTGRQYQIVNSDGRIMMSGVVFSQQMDVQMLAAGNYRLVVKKENGETMVAAFIKQ